jgi:hypothetical protein
MLVCWPKKQKFLNNTQRCPGKRVPGSPWGHWGPVWTEQLDEFDRSGQWTKNHRTQNHSLLKIINHFPKLKNVMEALAIDHWRFRDSGERMGTLCHLTIYADTYSADTLSRGFLFEFKMCPALERRAIGTVLRDRDSWTHYDDEWRTFCFMVPPDHYGLQESMHFCCRQYEG